jgi:hypothetical protein
LFGSCYLLPLLLRLIVDSSVRGVCSGCEVNSLRRI